MSTATTDPPRTEAGSRAATRLGRRETLSFFRRVSGADPLPALASLPGGNSLVKVPSIGSSVFIVRHPGHARQVLVTNQDTYVKGVDYRILGIVLGNGLLTNRDQESWQRNRSLVQPLFARRHLGPMTGHMVDAGADWLQALDTRTAEGESLDVNEAMMALTLDVVGRALFGTGIDGATTAVIGDSMTDLLKARRGVLRPRAVRPRHRRSDEPGVPGRDARALAPLGPRGGAQGDPRRHRPRPDRRALASGTAPQGDDLLSLLLAASDERGDDGLSREQVRDEVMTFLGAGHETTANALSWMFLALSQHPNVRRRLEEEIDEVLQGRRPTFEDVDRLPWTNAVLRRRCASRRGTRRLARRSPDDEIEGTRIRKGDVLIIAPYLLHRDPEFWPNPEGFDPERFLPGAGRERAAAAVLHAVRRRPPDLRRAGLRARRERAPHGDDRAAVPLRPDARVPGAPRGQRHHAARDGLPMMLPSPHGRAGRSPTDRRLLGWGHGWRRPHPVGPRGRRCADGRRAVDAGAGRRGRSCRRAWPARRRLPLR